MIETVDDLKVALNVEDLRRMSSDKVLHLVKMVQKEGVNEAVLTALRSIAPDTMFQFARQKKYSVKLFTPPMVLSRNARMHLTA